MESNICLKQYYNFTPDQCKAWDEVMSGKNVLIMAEGGAGKSYLVDKVMEVKEGQAVVVAFTGIAAQNVNGVTVSSLFNVPSKVIEEVDFKRPINSGLSKVFSKGRCKMLIVDECFTLRADILEYVDSRLRRLKGCDKNKPFGGIQVLMVGDPLQTTPIIGGGERGLYGQLYESKFIFNTPAFINGNFSLQVLHGSKRTQEEGLLKCLNSIRVADENHNRAIAWINHKCLGKPIPDNIPWLVTTHEAANVINKDRFHKIKGKPRKYGSKLTGKYLKKEMVVPESIELKVGCKVLIKVNQEGEDKEYFNGDTGVVTYMDSSGIEVCLDRNLEEVFVPIHKWEKCTYDWCEVNNKIIQNVIGTCEALPVRLGFAQTINSAQGRTMDAAVVSVGDWVTEGMLYVALSRLTSIDGLYLDKPLCPSKVKVDWECVDFYEKCKQGLR